MNVAIIGAGVVGRLIALQCLQQDRSVTLFERSPISEPNSAAYTSAGMLCPLGEIIHSPKEVTDLGWQSLALWPKLLEAIQQLDDENEAIYFQREGSIATALPQDAACFTQLAQDLSHKVEDASMYANLSANDLHTLEPALTNFNQGMHLASEGQLCNRQFIAVTNRILEKRLKRFEFQDIQQRELPDLQKQFDVVFDCRGFGAINAPLHDNQSSLRGIRGEVIRVRCEEVSLTRPVRVLHPRNSIYIVPKPNHEFVVGATEIESNSLHPVTVKSALELLSTLYCVHSGFGEATLLDTRAGIRAAYDDNIPRVTQHENVITTNGCYRHGWLVGPALVEKAMKQMENAA